MPINIVSGDGCGGGGCTREDDYHNCRWYCSTYEDGSAVIEIVPVRDHDSLQISRKLAGSRELEELNMTLRDACCRFIIFDIFCGGVVLGLSGEGS